MTKAASQVARHHDDISELDLKRARVIGRGLYAQRGVRMTLRALRTAVGETQVNVSEQMGVGQGDISRLENRESFDGCEVATLRRFVEALGGKLELVAVFPQKGATSGKRITIAGAVGR